MRAGDCRKEEIMNMEQVSEQKTRISRLRGVPLLIISIAIVLSIAMAARSMVLPPVATVILTGMVSDSVCGSDHGIRSPSDPECTRSCVELGAQYALMVGKLKVGRRMYILQGHESELDRFAGKEVRVKGRASGRDKIIVDQIARSYSEAAKAMN
jgi:hypothetical protein